MSDTKHKSSGPLESIGEWEDDVLARYPKDPEVSNLFGKEFRDYDNPARDTVQEFYRLNHINQTLDFARQKKEEFGAFDRREMSVWEACEFLDMFVDNSDPDTDLGQIQHLLQTSEAIRADGHPRWFILAGLVHDLGKILCLWDEPQWAVVGDTYPLGCKFSDKIVYLEFFEDNPDAQDPELMTECGVYKEGGGMDQVTMSWGHDEYMYMVAKDYLPEPALYMLRYHSCYAMHREGAYEHLMNDHDKEMFKWVKAFNPYDLYSKAEKAPDIEGLKPYYQELIAEYFPEKIHW